jgi:hypothetical protein
LDDERMDDWVVGMDPEPPTWTGRSVDRRVMRAWPRRRRTVERGERPVNPAALRSPQG